MEAVPLSLSMAWWTFSDSIAVDDHKHSSKMEQFYWWSATVVLLETLRINYLHCMGRFSSHAIGAFPFGRFLLRARDDPSLCT